jgi:acetate kinase
MTSAVLALNAGSSSIKLALYETNGQGALRPVASGLLESLAEKPHFVAHGPDGRVLAEQHWDRAGAHEDYLTTVLDFAEKALGHDRLAVAGHRVVHGGADHIAPELVTPALLDALEALVPLAPLHQPHSLAPIRALAKLRPGLQQVACFDTGFHHTMAPVATHIALPRALSESGVRRYGFHGLSYDYIAGRLAELAPALAHGRVIAAHLGSGASLCAMRGGASVDTTMGFTALDGLMMATRCGTIDPGVVLYLQQQRGMGAAEVEDLLYHRSGLLGVSGISGDMRALLQTADPHAAEAVNLFAFRIARETGALVSTLGGLDGFVFTAGIGEHTPHIRAAVCARLAWLGVRLDEDANQKGAGRISGEDSAIEVWVIPTDEEIVIARQALRVTKSSRPSA